ncbi:snRNA-activating protein complex subunit 4 isoform X2 [Onychomys torridus]|nr:snRNA-activating protein complex subunit 4 isoform X2 [Onychomys torridus]XP_036039758.1 snRNA-activating protein complex subunit 4 isoform X2 [Onychomys torridus]XP_036039759.1 snRNA-activating protein complex subunit 4 isoform X2 [Onychomys torridus]XP_036039761.1 snRNA-activating protein complex subunit 4 isoform X2 [Onychomys torridus]XP_036039762.1 snRNA-activating protein complex subunit 4 isoform X2 [Onychomys torridus]
MDIDAEREKITQEIQELERILYPGSSSVHLEVSESSLSSDSEADSLPDEDLETAGAPTLEEERWSEASNEEEDPKDKALPEDPETCLQLNMVYQEVIQEKLAEVSQLLAQNQEQQEEILFDLAGTKCPKVKDGKSLPSYMYIGHFMKPYFKDKVTGVGPPANEDTREKAAQGIKAFEQLLVTKWKHWEKALLRKSVVSDRLQRLLQPKLLKLEYLREKQSRVSSELDRQALEKQIKEAEKEIQDINQLPEEVLLGNRLDNHDWEKISNINFEGGRSAEEIQKFWQSSEHPSINKQEWSTEEVERLKAIAATHGHLEWHLIAEELGTSRSAFQCLQKFQQSNKALKRKEWTEEEDHMLAQLVQEMRVGSHIPYRKIVYFMEGRDSMQLIYRWTKSLDPSLKRGSWAPEEDAKLLQAVAKYGAQDWFKIREEVPGRSDAQCRDRYIRRLHFSLKKGRWNAKEEQQLIQLIEKYGVGHWARIASELPHRSGSQCLSKWKILARKKQRLQKRRGRRPHPSSRWSSSSSSDSSSEGYGSSGSSSSSSSSSSSGGEDSDMELEESLENGRALVPQPYKVPDIDLWVPTRPITSQSQREGSGCYPAHRAVSYTLDATQSHHKESSTTVSTPETGQVPMPCETHRTFPRRAQFLHLPDPHLASKEDPASKHVLKVPLEKMLKLVRTRPTTQSHTLVKQKPKQPPLPNSCSESDPGDSVAGPHLRRLWHGTFQNKQRRKRQALHRRLLKHRLLLAVIPWVGDIDLSCTQAPRRPAVVQSQADSIRMKLERARLTSTPVFTLLIQLLQIDTAGCMEVVRERKTQPPAMLQPGTQNPQPHLQVSSSAKNSTGCLLPSIPGQQTAKRDSHKGRPRLGSCGTEAPSFQVPVTAPRGGLRPKPKTVSELLREKRLRESRAKKATQALTAINSQLLISSPVILQPHLLPAPQGSPGAGPATSSIELSVPVAPVMVSSNSPGSWQVAGISATDKQPPTLQTVPLNPSHKGTQIVAPAAFRSLALAPRQVPTGCPLSTLGQSQASTTSQKQALPKVLPLLPAAPSPSQLPVQPLSLPPVLGPQASGQPLAAKASLPVNWVLTTQKLLSVPAPAGVGLPQSVTTPEPIGSPAKRLPSPTTTPACLAQLPASADTEPKGPQGQELPPTSGPEKKALDLSLLSQESEAATLAWLKGCQGACVPPLGSRMSYQPPSLCSLRALSGLLFHKKDLEQKASSLVASQAAGSQSEPKTGALQTSLGLVQEQFRDNPAYLLLKTRFLAVFSLPALLATLPPNNVPTTLSPAMAAGSESDTEDLGDLELKDRARQSDCLACRIQASPAATDPAQRAPGPGEDSAPSHMDASDDLDVLRTRHARHSRKRKLL